MSEYESKWKCVKCGRYPTPRYNPVTDMFEIYCGCGKTTAKKLERDSWDLVREGGN